MRTGRQDVARPDGAGKIRVQVFQDMRGQFVQVQGLGVFAGDDAIRVDPIAEHVDPAGEHGVHAK
jgi:hypothetical protein